MEAPPATSHLYGQLPMKDVRGFSQDSVARLTVDIATNTCVTTDGLSVLAPKTIGRLGIDKTVRVHNGRDVEVELINKRLDARV